MTDHRSREQHRVATVATVATILQTHMNLYRKYSGSGRTILNFSHMKSIPVVTWLLWLPVAESSCKHGIFEVATPKTEWLPVATLKEGKWIGTSRDTLYYDPGSVTKAIYTIEQDFSLTPTLFQIWRRVQLVQNSSQAGRHAVAMKVDAWLMILFYLERDGKR